MRNFQQKSKWKKLSQSNLALGALGVLLLFFAWNVFGLVGKMEDTVKNKKIAENKVADLQAQKTKLSSDVERLKTEGGVEETIRDKFGLVREGEDVIVIVDDKTPAPETQEANSSGFFSFFKNLFK